MGERRRWRRQGAARTLLGLGVLVAGGAAGSCRASVPETAGPAAAILRVGLGQNSATNPIIGLRQLSPLLTMESLARTGEDGRMQPWVAESWALGDDGRVLHVRLRPHVKFHDASLLDAATAAALVPIALKDSLGPLFEDVDSVTAAGADAIDIRFRQASPFLLESLEVPIRKPGPPPIGTGPFVPVPDTPTELVANGDYYDGRPTISQVHVEPYPSVRTAWAEMLRDRIDMLWEVGVDALDSMGNSSQVSVFTFTRRYQYLLALNPESPTLRSREVRHALNLAIDRRALVKNGLNGYGVASSGPIWPSHWILPADLPRFEYAPDVAASALARRPGARTGGRVRFSCLIVPDSVNERVALEVKRQLEAVGVDMALEEVTQDQIVQRASSRHYDAALIELISGPTTIRPYLTWHSRGPLNWGRFGNATVDTALERVRHAPADDAYRDAIVGLQQAFMDDPPAMFLAWSVRARAVSKRFAVQQEPGRDVLSTLRLWKPGAGASRH